MGRLVLFDGDKTTVLSEKRFIDEAALESLLEQRPELIALEEVDAGALPLVPIGRQVPLGGQSLDLLFADIAGRLTVVEAKLRRNPEIRREVVGQILEYASYLSSWTVEDVEAQASRYGRSNQTPTRFRGEGLYELLSRTVVKAPGEEDLNEASIRQRVSNCLGRSDIRLLIAVDRVVEPLRGLVVYLNTVSRLRIYLLEVQEYASIAGHALASLNVYGPPATSGPTRSRGIWDEERFFPALEEQATPEAAVAATALYSFIRDHSDSLIWGTGLHEGTVAFGVRNGADKFSLCFVTTKGNIWINMAAVNKRLTREQRLAFLAQLRSLGVSAPEDLADSEKWPSFDAAVLSDPATLASFQKGILELRDKLSGSAMPGIQSTE